MGHQGPRGTRFREKAENGPKTQKWPFLEIFRKFQKYAFSTIICDQTAKFCRAVNRTRIRGFTRIRLLEDDKNYENVENMFISTYNDFQIRSEGKKVLFCMLLQAIKITLSLSKTLKSTEKR